jgi:hypothetical protein
MISKSDIKHFKEAIAEFVSKRRDKISAAKLAVHCYGVTPVLQTVKTAFDWDLSDELADFECSLYDDKAYSQDFLRGMDLVHAVPSSFFEDFVVDHAHGGVVYSLEQDGTWTPKE